MLHHGKIILDRDMNDPKSSLPDDAGPSIEGSKPISLSRRRFAQGAAPVVLGSLISTPVLANGGPPYHCTISGKLSGNTSSPHDNTTPCNTLGRSPGYWGNKPNITWPGGLIQGDLPDSGCAWTNAVKGTLFKNKFADAFRCKDGTIYDAAGGFPSGTSKFATMQQVLKTGGGLNDTAISALGRAAVASLLNALHPELALTYPLTPAKVIAMFNAVYLGGTYQVNETTFWTRDQVKTYFESLYEAL